ncbi:MAG: hypothetical protein WC872_04260, partial [Candidatus Absconditabacterales bacterium]
MSDLKSTLKTTPKYISILAKNGINTIKDFLQYFPRTYEDRASIRNLKELIFNEKGITATKGQIISKKFFARGGKKIYDIQFLDEIGNKGYISIFNSGFLASKLIENKRYVIVGKPILKFGKIIFSHPDVIPTEAPEEESVNSEQGIVNSNEKLITRNSGLVTEVHNVGRIYPIYPELNGISPGRFAKKVWELIDKVDEFFDEYLPQEFLKEFNLMDVITTIKEIHYPTNLENNKKAFQRVFFDRLLRIQLFS